jgi:hypothetical protein
MSPTWPLRCGSDKAGPNRQATTQAGHHTPHSNSGHTHLQQHSQAVRQEKEEEKTFKSNVTDLAAPLRERQSRAKQAGNNPGRAPHTTQQQWPHTPATTQAVRQEKEEEKTFKSNVTDLAAPLRERQSRAKQAGNNPGRAPHTTQQQWPHTPATTQAVRQSGRKRKKKKHLSQMSPTWPLRCGSDKAGPNRQATTQAGHHTPHSNSGHTHLQQHRQSGRQEKEEEKTFKSNVTDLAAPLRERQSRAKQAGNNPGRAPHTTQQQWPHTPATTVRQSGRKRKKKKHLSQMSPTWPLRCGSDKAGPNRQATTQAGHHTPHSNSGHTHLQHTVRQSGRKRKKKKHLSQMSPTWPLRCGSDKAGPNRQATTQAGHHTPHSNSGHTHLQHRQSGSQAGKGRRKNI